MGSNNKEILAEKNSISNEQLLNWGLLGKVNKEKIIDRNIKNIREPNEKEFKNFQKNWLIKMRIENEKELDYWIKINGFTQNSLIIFLKRKWKLEQWNENKFKDYIDNYFLERKEKYDNFTFLMIRVSNKDLANELYLRIKEQEETFENVASFYSEGYEKDKNGSVGPVLISDIHPIIKEILLASKLNKLNKPIKIDKKFVILKLIKREIATLNKETRNALLEELGEKYLFKKLQNNNY